MIKGFLSAGLLFWLTAALPAVAGTEKKLLGDLSDGSRAVPVHLTDLVDPQGRKISPGDARIQPFSTRRTCGRCHNYDIVSKGWHFNAVDSNVSPGRVGQPWIFVDTGTCTQIPLSYRSWEGAFKPEQVGLTTWQFTQLFGRQMPGGGPGELESDRPEEIVRQLISGKLEINCLACHNAAPGQDQAEYASQVSKQNFRWAPTAGCGFASVSGSAAAQGDTYDPLMSDAVSVHYKEGTFDYRGRVLLDVVRKVPAQRCYFCHSNKDVGEGKVEKWADNEDVHLAAGLSCVDCHRHGIEHDITRGYENENKVSANALAAAVTCEGCHLGTDSSSPTAGGLGAPVPVHKGIPTIHFEKLTCTACHSGARPAEKAGLTKTSRAHALGTFNVNRSDDALPHILYPVFATGQDGKIGPHKLIWPAFWAGLKEDTVTPIDISVVKQAAGGKVVKEALPRSGDWPGLMQERVAEVLRLLAAAIEDKPVYVCGGKLYSLNDSGGLVGAEHSAAKPYLWPIAHDVRPAAQALGVRGCGDCHRTDAPFFFGEIAVDSPLKDDRATKTMVEFQHADAFFVKAFAMSFVFRPWLKLVILCSCACLAGVLVLYGLKALGHIMKFLAEGNQRAQ